MNIEVEFNSDKSEAKLTASIEHKNPRPPPHLRITVTSDQVLAEFKRLHPKVEVQSMTGGPQRLYNCKQPDLSAGTWTLKLASPKKSVPTKRIAKKKTTTKTKKGA